jgi:hypothetical protein
MSAVPGPVYGLEVPPGEILIPAAMEFPASVSSSLVPQKHCTCDAMHCIVPARLLPPAHQLRPCCLNLIAKF